MASAEYTFNATVYNVVDGDTVDVEIDLGFKVKIRQRLRLAGIDTPERGKTGYTEATTRLAALVQTKPVVIKTHKVSKFGYYLADIYLDGQHINSMMITEGLARPYFGEAKPS